MYCIILICVSVCMTLKYAVYSFFLATITHRPVYAVHTMIVSQIRLVQQLFCCLFCDVVVSL